MTDALDGAVNSGLGQTAMASESVRRSRSASAPGRSHAKRRSVWVRLLPLGFAAVLIAAVVIGLWNAANPPQGDAPNSFGSYQMAQIVTGPAAVAQMSKLHGKGVGVDDGYVAHYQGPSGGAVAYVGETASEAAALELLKQMEVRIGAGNQYFTNLRAITVDGVKLFAVRSGSESHYFWATGKKVAWVAFDREDQAGLAAAVRAIQ